MSSSCTDETNVTDCMEYHWTYEGDSAPNTWADCFADCSGQSQSPINLVGSMVDGNLAELDTHYEDVSIELKNNGHTIEFEYEEGSVLSLNGDDYNLLQFHFHTGSEHTVAGQQYPMEVHLVHQEPNTGNLAVIGIFVVNGNENDFIANFIDNLPQEEDDHYSSMTKVNVANLLPFNPAYLHYTGSLTTPPCSEIVSWFVMKTPVEASSNQIERISEILKDNFRPVQMLNGREISEFN